MSLPPWQQPGNPANPSSPNHFGVSNDVPKRSPNTPEDFILTAVIVGIFGVLIAINFLMQL